MRYLIENPGRVTDMALEHIVIVGIAILFAILIAVPLGVLVTRVRWMEQPVINTAGVLYTIPSLAMFILILPLFGLSNTTAIVALTVYSLLAIVRNTVAGIDNVDPSLLDAARGMGMTSWQRLLHIELPLALPVIMAGIRTAAVAAIGIATIAPLIGAGGLGRLIFDGIRTLNNNLIIAGAVAASILALIVDTLLQRVSPLVRRDLRLAQ